MLIKRLLCHLTSVIIFLTPVLYQGAAQAQFAEQPLPETSSIVLETTIQSPNYHSCGNEIVPVVNDSYEQQVVELVNQERAKHDLPPLKRVDFLDEAARYHSADLGQDDYFDHDSYDRIGEELDFVCIWWARIQTYYPNVRAENIAAGYQTPASVVAAWMDSTGHRQNILSAYSDEIGVGYYEGTGQYSSYWTQDFGDRSAVYPVVINGEAAVTDNRMVTLYVYGKWSEMRLQNNDETWTSWQPFQNSLTWQLPVYSGEHRVTVEMRDSTKFTTSSDTIFLSAPPAEPELGNLPDSITFTYSISGGEYLPEFAEHIPLNIGNSDLLYWEVTTEGTWFVVTPTTGTTPDAFKILPGVVPTDTKMIPTGVITVKAQSQMGTECSPHQINVSMQIIEGSFNRVYIPILVR